MFKILSIDGGGIRAGRWDRGDELEALCAALTAEVAAGVA